MSKHTPGPWEVETYKEPYNNFLLTYEVVSGGYFVVAKCGTGDFEIPSNAHLIAAAPELLEALERVLSQYEALLTACKISSVSTVSQARAAIAKAKGE